MTVLVSPQLCHSWLFLTMIFCSGLLVDNSPVHSLRPFAERQSVMEVTSLGAEERKTWVQIPTLLWNCSNLRQAA